MYDERRAVANEGNVSMPRLLVCRIFELWLRENRSRFKYRPRLIKAGRDSRRIRFPMLAQELYCSVRRSGTTIATKHKRKIWDLLWDVDLLERRSARGYYCALCERGYRRYYPSRRLLWAAHCFEPLLEWINRLDESHWIYLFGRKDHYSFAQLGSFNEVEEMRSKADFVHAFPAIRRKIGNG
jgi:hypothetical protein